MAKQRRHAALALAPLALLLSQPTQAAWKFTPTLELRETYTDNLRLARSGREQGDWITEITPGFTVSKRSDRLRFDATYQLHYFAGAEDIGDDVDRAQSSLAARLAAEVVSDWLYFDGAASMTDVWNQNQGKRAESRRGAYSNPERYRVRVSSTVPPTTSPRAGLKP